MYNWQDTEEPALKSGLMPDDVVNDIHRKPDTYRQPRTPQKGDFWDGNGLLRRERQWSRSRFEPHFAALSELDDPTVAASRDT
jgi:hypothetical protein